MLKWVDYAFCWFGRNACIGFYCWRFWNHFFMVHFNILLMHCCIFLSMVTMFFRTVTNEEIIDIMIHWFLGIGRLLFYSILILNRIMDRILLWGTPISCYIWSQSVFIRVWNVRPSKECFIKMWSLPCRPGFFVCPMTRLYQAFSKSNRTAAKCSFLMNASLIRVSLRTIWSMMLLLALNPVCRFERRLLDSRNHDSLRLIILSRVLPVKLVKAMVYNW